jgi:small subunit ribosomal protein S13
MRIAGIELQDNWRVGYALTKIKGIGWSAAEAILKNAKIAGDRRIADLKTSEIAEISGNLEKYLTEGELARKVRGDIQRLQLIGSYRGIRHQRNLPVRGQRTRSNARSKRGKRKTVGAFKKEVLSKMKQGEDKEAKS